MKRTGNQRLDGLILLEQARPATETVLAQALRAEFRAVEATDQQLLQKIIRAASRPMDLKGMADAMFPLVRSLKKKLTPAEYQVVDRAFTTSYSGSSEQKVAAWERVKQMLDAKGREFVQGSGRGTRVREAGGNFRLMGPNATTSWADTLTGAVDSARASGKRVEIKPQNDHAWSDIQNRFQCDWLVVLRGAITKGVTPVGRDPW